MIPSYSFHISKTIKFPFKYGEYSLCKLFILESLIKLFVDVDSSVVLLDGKVAE